MAQIALVYHSGHGHTKIQADHIASGLRSVAGVSVTVLTSAEAIADMSALHQADAIVFGCPTYMGGPSAEFKAFIDATGGVWYKQGWKDKIAAGFTNSGSPAGDKLATLQILFNNAMQHGMIWVSAGMNPAPQPDGTVLNRTGVFAGAVSQSPQGSAEPIRDDQLWAEVFGARVALATLRWVRGR